MGQLLGNVVFFSSLQFFPEERKDLATQQQTSFLKRRKERVMLALHVYINEEIRIWNDRHHHACIIWNDTANNSN
jgi:hypothetical protein